MEKMKLIKANLIRGFALRGIKCCRRHEAKNSLGGASEKIGHDFNHIKELNGVTGEIAAIESILIYWIWRHMEMALLAMLTIGKIMKINALYE